MLELICFYNRRFCTESCINNTNGRIWWPYETWCNERPFLMNCWLWTRVRLKIWKASLYLEVPLPVTSFCNNQNYFKIYLLLLNIFL